MKLLAESMLENDVTREALRESGNRTGSARADAVDAKPGSDEAARPAGGADERRRKKIPLTDRQPLTRPGSATEVCSVDFAFDRVASWRTLKCLAIVDDATHESVAVNR